MEPLWRVDEKVAASPKALDPCAASLLVDAMVEKSERINSPKKSQCLESVVEKKPPATWTKSDRNSIPQCQDKLSVSKNLRVIKSHPTNVAPPSFLCGVGCIASENSKVGSSIFSLAPSALGSGRAVSP